MKRHRLTALAEDQTVPVGGVHPAPRHGPTSSLTTSNHCSGHALSSCPLGNKVGA